jgi:hypothetical protein
MTTIFYLDSSHPWYELNAMYVDRDIILRDFIKGLGYGVGRFSFEPDLMMNMAEILEVHHSIYLDDSSLDTMMFDNSQWCDLWRCEGWGLAINRKMSKWAASCIAMFWLTDDEEAIRFRLTHSDWLLFPQKEY